MDIRAFQENRLWIIPGWRVVFAMMPKAACTSIKIALREKFGSEKPGDNSGRKLFRYRDKAWDLSVCMRITSVRSPWERIRSLYVDKILGSRDAGHKLIKPIGLDNIGCFAEMSFGEFVEVVCAASDTQTDKHLISQYHVIESPVWGGAADVMLRFEGMAHDWTKLRELYPLLPKELGTHNVSQFEKPDWTPNAIKLIGDRYARDVALLNYGEPPL